VKKKIIYLVLCVVLILIVGFCALYIINNKSVLFSYCGEENNSPKESYSAIMCSAKNFDGENLEIVLDDENNTVVKLAVKKESLIEKLSQMQLESIYGVQTRAFIPDDAVTRKFHEAEIDTVQLLTDYDGYEKYFEIIDISSYHKPSFVGTVLEETTEYMIVEPVPNKADGDMGDRVKIEYGTDHYDYVYGKGRRVVIYYYPNEAEETADGMKLIKSDDISTEGFREFELEVEPSHDKQKKLILSNDDIKNFTSFGHISNTNLYYYGLENVMITIKGFTMPLDFALENGRITLDGIIAKCNKDVFDGVIEDLVYDDGGSKVYKYPQYTIIKYHTLEGNSDVYIGSREMGIEVKDK